MVCRRLTAISYQLSAISCRLSHVRVRVLTHPFISSRHRADAEGAATGDVERAAEKME